MFFLGIVEIKFAYYFYKQCDTTQVYPSIELDTEHPAFVSAVTTKPLTFST